MCDCEEIWKDIIDYQNYRISSKGNVYSKNIKRNIKHKIEKKDGYHRIAISKNGKQKFFHIHKLVGIHFIPNPENKPTVDHIKGDKDNNCICSLRWANKDEQQWNQPLPKNNTSGHKNIHWHKRKNKWQILVTNKGYEIYLGSFDCLEIAIDLRDWYYEHILERECLEKR